MLELLIIAIRWTFQLVSFNEHATSANSCCSTGFQIALVSWTLTACHRQCPVAILSNGIFFYEKQMI